MHSKIAYPLLCHSIVAMAHTVTGSPTTNPFTQPKLILMKHHQTTISSEEKSELNSNQPANNPDCLLPSNLANLKLKPQPKPSQEFISSEHIDPKMGYLKRVYLAADSTEPIDSTKPKDWTKVILQHPQACNQCL